MRWGVSPGIAAPAQSLRRFQRLAHAIARVCALVKHIVLRLDNERIRIQAGEAGLEGALCLPADRHGVVLFASGNGACRAKPPNDYVGSVLRNAQLGTMWLDLLTPSEACNAQLRSDIGLLSQRLGIVCAWLRQHDSTRDLPIGLFGAGDGATAALQAGAALDDGGSGLAAIVSRGARPDCTGTLDRISAPTLLIVGGLDDGALGPNRAAYAAMRCKKRIEIVPGATHDFDEPGSPEVVARLARSWFLRYAHRV